MIVIVRKHTSWVVSIFFASIVTTDFIHISYMLVTYTTKVIIMLDLEERLNVYCCSASYN